MIEPNTMIPAQAASLILRGVITLVS